MALGERQTQKQRRKTPSFSSTLLDAIYHSIDEPTELQRPIPQRINAAKVDGDIESLRRAIMVEKWMESYSAAAKSTQRQPNSASSADSTISNTSGTDSSASFPPQKPLFSPAKIEGGRFTRTKLRALKMYGDLKKVKEPISPGGRIANFLNSIFSPRNLKKNQGGEDWGSVRKSRSMKDYTIATSCLSRNPNSSRSNKSKRSVRFCPISEGDGNNYSINASVPKTGCNFINKSIDSFRFQEVKNARSRKFRENEGEFDDKSCCSSDLFELENIGAYDQELPVYGTTDLKKNRAIASGLTA